MREGGNLESAAGAEIVIDDRKYLNFGGSSYLGLSAHPAIIAAGIAGLNARGSGMQMPSSQGLSVPETAEIEHVAADFFRVEASLFFSCGYLFPLAALAALDRDRHVVFADEFAHFAIRDGIRASGLAAFSYRHCDPEDLRTKLKSHISVGQTPCIATDGLFSTFGNIPPLDELFEICSGYGGKLLIDESHSFGTMGASGRGTIEHFGLVSPNIVAGGSLGKAFGACGGIALGSSESIRRLKDTPAGLGAGKGAPHLGAMCAESLKLVKRTPLFLKNLRQNTSQLKQGLQQIGIDVGNSDAPIAAFSRGSFEANRACKQQLRERGIFVYHSKYIGTGTDGVIRLAVFSDHTNDQISYLLQELCANV